MKEEFLHHIWKYGLFNKNGLKTEDGRSVTIISVGYQNYDAGPDFFNAKIIIGDTVWAGNIEIHIDEKDWVRHGHQKDRAYNNVVLHVVYKANAETVNALGQSIPVVQLRGKIPRHYWDTYLQFMRGERYIPCEGRVWEVPNERVAVWLERILVERLERKSKAILSRLESNKGDWHQTLFEQVALNFGFKTNAAPMEMLARSVPFKLLSKYGHDCTLIEALLFGQAGLLRGSFDGDYPKRLKSEYAFICAKHALEPMYPVVWKFSRMRPANFPTIRIAQLANLFHHHSSLFSKIRDCAGAAEWEKILSVSASKYWSGNYRFDQPSKRSGRRNLGKSSRVNVMINTIVPVLFAYSRQIDSRPHLDMALKLMQGLPAENNSIIRKMERAGFNGGNASSTQALLELRSRYCSAKKCLNCAIGSLLLRSARDDQ